MCVCVFCCLRFRIRGYITLKFRVLGLGFAPFVPKVIASGVVLVDLDRDLRLTAFILKDSVPVLCCWLCLLQAKTCYVAAFGQQRLKTLNPEP